MFNDIFTKRKPVPEKLTAYGFRREGNGYQYTTGIRNDEFSLTVQIDKNGIVDTSLIGQEDGEEYILYKTDAAGSYVGEVRAAVLQVLGDISEQCFIAEIFKTRQAQMAIQFVREQYGDELEFLWAKFSDNAVWRRKDTGKWYGLLLTVRGNKIGLDTSEILEIIDLRMLKDEAAGILSKNHYYPGWHMNKKSWYTLVLDDSISDEEICTRIRESYQLAVK